LENTQQSLATTFVLVSMNLNHILISQLNLRLVSSICPATNTNLLPPPFLASVFIVFLVNDFFTLTTLAWYCRVRVSLSHVMYLTVYLQNVSLHCSSFSSFVYDVLVSDLIS
jgi:hypothetical protein